MFRATHLYRSLGVLVAEAGSDVTSSLPVLGRALAEVISQVGWLLEPLSTDDADTAGRVIACRSYLLYLAGLVTGLDESEDFDFPDAQQLAAQLAAAKEQGAMLFGRDGTALSRRNPDYWTIAGESGSLKPGWSTLSATRSSPWG